MADDEVVEQGHGNSFAVVAGYLPADLDVLRAYHDRLAAEVEDADPVGAYTPAVMALKELLDDDPIVRMFVIEMIEQALVMKDAPQTIKRETDLLRALNTIVRTAPVYAPPGQRVFFPMSALFKWMMYTTAGMAAFRNAPFNDAIRAILREWCAYLDSPESREVINTGPNGWLSGPARKEYQLDDFEVDWSAPYGGFASYNDFFHREIKADKRPIAQPGDQRVVVSANDGTVFALRRDVALYDRFWLKDQPYSLHDMLADAEGARRYVGGDVLQSFLSGANYHRWHSPIDGSIVRAEVVDGLQFSEAESQGFDPDSGVLSAGYESSVNTRGIVYVQSSKPSLGTVVVMPIGITEISSITITVRAGQEVRKGDELGWFSYGGSTLCLIFQPGAIDRFTVRPPLEGGPPASKLDVNAQVAVAR